MIISKFSHIEIANEFVAQVSIHARILNQARVAKQSDDADDEIADGTAFCCVSLLIRVGEAAVTQPDLHRQTNDEEMVTDKPNLFGVHYNGFVVS